MNLSESDKRLLWNFLMLPLGVVGIVVVFIGLACGLDESDSLI